MKPIPVPVDMNAVVIGLLIAILAFFIKRWLGQMDDSIKAIEAKMDRSDVSHAECRETLPLRFAPKEETSENIKELFRGQNDHNARITALEKAS